MNIGILFNVPNEYGFTLSRILKCIGENALLWEISEDEVFEGSMPFPLQGEYSWCELLDKLPKTESYVVFCMIKAYNALKCKSGTLRQFLNGTCELMIFIFDVTEVEIYCKNSDELKRIAEKISKEFAVETIPVNIENCTRKRWDKY